MTQAIGIFDSGVGGLTVAAALARRLPDEPLLYLGDVARLPYGTKSPATVVRYATQAAGFLTARGVKMLVVACNTASAHALPSLQQAFPGLPVVGVVEVGARAAALVAPSGRILVAATEGTCRSGAYERAIARHAPEARVTCVPCPLFVALAEEGMTDGPIVEGMARATLEPWLKDTDALVLGCTHFPLLADCLARVAGPSVRLVDCARAVAEEVAARLAAGGLAAPPGSGEVRLAATDAPDRLARIAAGLFPAGGVGTVEVVDL